MRIQLLKFIRCPICKNEFNLKIVKESNIEIEDGILICKNCGFSSAITDGVVNLLFNLDPHTLKEVNLHLKDQEEMFEKELINCSIEELERRWAYMEQESSKDYGKKIMNIFTSTIKNCNIKKTDVILDLGAGTGLSSAQLAKISEYCIALDLCKPIKLELSKVFLKNEGVFFERCMANMMKLPIADECIDVVVSVASLHHVTDLVSTLFEIRRVLKEGGKLIMIGEPVIPSDYLGTDEEFIKQKVKGFNEHQYTANDWFKACESAGLYAIDGGTSHDNLDKYYEVDKNGLQNPLPIFIKNKKDENGKLKIAFLSQEFSKNCTGGICRYTYDLTHALAELGNEVHVITKSDENREYDCRDKKVFVHKIILESVDFLNLPVDMNISKKNISYSYSSCLKLLNLIDNYGIQIVEAPLWDAEGFVFSLVKSIPLVIRLETPLFKVAEIQKWEITKDLKFANWMEKETVRRADKAIAISKDIGTLINNHHNVSKERIDLCPLGIEFPEKNKLLNETNKNNFDVLFVGRLEKRKGIGTLFKAIPKVLEEIPNTNFNIIGKDTDLAPDGGSYRRFLSESLDNKYYKNVKFVGYVNDIELKNYFKKCDLLVAPSLYESFGLIYLEAMAWGKPVIGCEVGGIPEIVESFQDGILIPPDDENALAEAIIKLLKDKNLRIKMGMHGRKKVEDKFSTTKMAENTYNIYKSLIYDEKCVVMPFKINQEIDCKKNVNNAMEYQNFHDLFMNKKWDEIFDDDTPVSIYDEQLKWINPPSQHFIDYVTKRIPLSFDGVPPDKINYEKDPTYMITQMHRLWITIDVIKEYLTNDLNYTILDIGAFPFSLDIILREYLNFHGDIFATTNWMVEEQWINEIKKRKIDVVFTNLDPFVQSGIDLLNIKNYLDFEDNSIDLVICTHVIEHLYHPLVLFKEIYRVVKKGGKVLVSTDNAFMLSTFIHLCSLNDYLHEPIETTAAMVFNQWRGHNRFFSGNDLKMILEKTGFNVVDTHFYEILYNSFSEDYFKFPVTSFPKWKADILTCIPKHRNEVIVIGEK